MTTQHISTTRQDPSPSGPAALFSYLLLGIAFGVVLTNRRCSPGFAFRRCSGFQSFRMYGIIGSAIVTAAISLTLIKRAGIQSVSGELISVPGKTLGHGVRYALGGTIFGLGWALTGACPGPLFALVGNGVTVMLAAILSALMGT